ncbi:MAG TPA: hypothetical protein VF026_21155 [Ktedonobacteraceae bacterium]
MPSPSASQRPRAPRPPPHSGGSTGVPRLQSRGPLLVSCVHPRDVDTTNGASVPMASLPLSLVERERDAQSPSLHSLQGCPDCAKAGAEHLDFVVMQRLPQRYALAYYSDQTARELAGVAKRAVGTRAVGWHDMDSIAEQGDVASLPVLDGNGTPHGQEKGPFWIRLLCQGRQRRIPVLRQLHGRSLKIGAIHGLQVLVRDGELFPAAKQSPHQVVLGVLEAQAGPELPSRFLGWLPKPDASEHHSGVWPGDHREPFVHRLWQQRNDLVSEERLASEPPHIGFEHLGVRKELLADARANAVGGDEDVPDGPCPVRKGGADSTVFLLLIAGKRLVEMHDVVEPSEQDLAQRQTIHSRPDGDELIAAAFRERLGDSFLQLATADAEHGDAAARLATGSQEQFVQARLQALAQRLLAAGVNMDAMALSANRKPGIALVHRDIDSRLAQPLGQTQAAEACTNHEHP